MATLALGCITAAGADASCTFSATAPIFGTYNPVGGATLTANGLAQAICNPQATVIVTLSSGSGTFAQRTLLGPKSPVLNYNLYVDAAFTQIWGDGTQGTATVGGTFTGTGQATIYGRVPGGQDVPIGTYSSTITATLTF